MPRQNHHPVKQWFLTISQVEQDEDAVKYLQLIQDKATTLQDKVLEYVVANELHADNGRHVHAYIKLEKGFRHSLAPDFFHVFKHTADCQPCRSAQAVIKYCTKDGDFTTNISEKLHRKQKAKVGYNTLVTKTVVDAIKTGIISYHHAKTYEHARRLCTLSSTYNHNTTRGLWFYGPSGTGKSRAARESVLISGTRYVKSQNKWWDNYNGEPIVILDDLDTDMLGHHLKIWADRYHCTGEVKGSAVNLTHRQFIVTSNLSIDELFRKSEHAHLLEPLKRRFTEVEFPDISRPFTQPNMYQTAGYTVLQPEVQGTVPPSSIQLDGPGEQCDSSDDASDSSGESLGSHDTL